MQPPLIPGLQVRKASDNQDWGICIALYGPPGVGKTVRAADLADCDYGKPVLFVDAEGGTRSIAHRNDVEVIDVKSWVDVTKVVSYLKRTSSLPWKTVVFDNLSEYNSLCLKAIVGDDQPQIQHYGKSTSEMLNFVRVTRDLSRTAHINIIYIVWESPEKDESTGIIKRDVGFTPSLARQFPGIIDMVGYMTASGTPPYNRKLDFAPSPRTAAKMRRSASENAKNIPLTIEFNLEQKPLVDIVNTLVGGLPWPTTKYGSARRTVSNNEESKEN